MPLIASLFSPALRGFFIGKGLIKLCKGIDKVRISCYNKYVSEGSPQGREVVRGMEGIMYGLKLAEADWENMDTIDWYDKLDDALDAAWEAIEDGDDAAEIEIRSFNDDGDCRWDFPITFADDGSAWSEDETAREEMGIFQGGIY